VKRASASLLVVAMLLLSAPPAAAQVTYLESYIWCFSGRMEIDVPRLVTSGTARDGHRDYAIAHLYRYTNQGWVYYGATNMVYNDDVPVVNRPGFITIGGPSGAQMSWFDSGTVSRRAVWNIATPARTSMAAMVFWWDGRAQRWYPFWAHQPGTGAYYCTTL
jgi:hypothetical protein